MTTWTHPIDPKLVGDLFGDHEPPRTSPHRGVDYKGGDKNLIANVVDATVVDIKYNSCLGWICNTKVDGASWYIAYCHLHCNQHGSNCDGSGHEDGSTCMKNLKVGDKVKTGQPVGRVGNTGTCSRGSHLHATLSKSRNGYSYGKVYDLFKYINKQIAKQKVTEVEEVKEEVTEPIVTAPDCEPKPITPEPTQGIPAKILEAVRTILLWLKK